MDSNESSMTSNNNKPFSIRDYVLESRERDIRNNWPFDEKYLDVLLKYGIHNLLPPFESPSSVRYSLCRSLQSNHAEEPDAHIDSNDNSCMGPQEEKKMIKADSSLCFDEAISEITRQMSPLSLSANKNEHDDGRSAVPSTKCLSKRQKKRKNKHKIRSMAEIYAEARPCTLEDCTITDGSTSSSVATMMLNVCNQSAPDTEKCVQNTSGSMTTTDDDYKPISEVMKIAHSVGGSEVNGSFIGEYEQLIKFKWM